MYEKDVIKEMIQNRKDLGQTPYEVKFSVTTPKHSEDFHDNPTILKIIKLFEKYGHKIGAVDTVMGAYNLNRDWLEHDGTVKCYVEYCGVYPIEWDTEDVAEFDRMENEGEIVVLVNWIVNGEYVPNH